MIQNMQLQNHPTVQMMDFLFQQNPGFKAFFDKGLPSKDTYISDLKVAMEYDTLEDILSPENTKKISMTLRMAAQLAMVTAIAFWDCEGTGQEFIMPKVPGVSMMDPVSIFHKAQVIRNKEITINNPRSREILKYELQRLEYGSMIYSDNFSIYPISPTRVLICFSSYFRAFFPFMDASNRVQVYPPLLDKEQFDKHFFEPMRMELFKPCKNIFNRVYDYDVRTLTKEEVFMLNSLMLDMETEAFVFHDYEKIRESLEYYDKSAQFAMGKRHEFGEIGG